MTEPIADEALAGWRWLAMVLTDGAVPGEPGYAEPFVDRHPPYASGSFHDGWVRVCVGRHELCRVRPEPDGRRKTEFAQTLAAAGPALHAAAEEVRRLRERVAELERQLAGTPAELTGWRTDAGAGVAAPRWAGSPW